MIDSTPSLESFAVSSSKPTQESITAEAVQLQSVQERLFTQYKSDCHSLIRQCVADKQESRYMASKLEKHNTNLKRKLQDYKTRINDNDTRFDASRSIAKDECDKLHKQLLENRKTVEAMMVKIETLEADQSAMTRLMKTTLEGREFDSLEDGWHKVMNCYTKNTKLVEDEDDEVDDQVSGH